MEQIIYGLHEKKESSVGRKKPTPSIQSYSLFFEAVYARNSRDRVIIERMTTYLARERQNVTVEMEENGEANTKSCGY